MAAKHKHDGRPSDSSNIATPEQEKPTHKSTKPQNHKTEQVHNLWQ
jgi:hypothetical protein